MCTYSGDYGFIPLQLLGKLSEKVKSNEGENANYLDMHTKLINSGSPNCAGSQCRILTDLNIPLWEDLLTGYRDHQLIYFLKYGFPLGMLQLPAFESNTTVLNHSTAKQYPASIKPYLQTEISNKAIMGPYDKPPLSKFSLLAYAHTSQSRLWQSQSDSGPQLASGQSSEWFCQPWQLHGINNAKR